MSMNPVQSVHLAPEIQIAEPRGQSPRPAGGQVQLGPDSGPQPNRHIHDQQKDVESSQMPQDEVQVQRDSGGSGEIVIRYLDRAGNVILQVPSSQVLGLARAIEQALDEQIKSRAAENAAQVDSAGGHSHGN